ncbi:phage-related holin [Dysgonomonas alginatilytica]|uniref:Phage-related holin n=1 Tax=Dysgonomonas alginatilytica TaxID=1605892 RepID=A0A2V3Q1Q1_9BACT|nr:phage holin family protein [Dysgonomonas alginatilytica]PXV69245.1 phage-related holin [Dysgonomonas alginatilytica]
MKLLFINAFLNKDYEALYQKIELELIMWVIVLIAIIIDLISGLRKASQMGELHTSYGFRRTVSKMVQYYGLLCFAFMFDILSSMILPLPYFTMLASFFLVFIEAKSVLEKAQDKDRRKINENLKDLITLIENKDNLLKGVSEILKNSENLQTEQHGTDK